MRFSLRSGAVLALAVTAASCVSDAARPTLPPPPETPAEAPRPLGVYQIAVTGIGTDQMRSTITAKPEAGGARGSLTNAGTGLVFEQVGGTTVAEGSRTAGGQRYVTFTYRVRNSTGGTLNNVTLLMVTRSNTIAGTPISSLKRFDGTDASASIAAQVVPTGAVAMASDLVTMTSPYPDVLQVLQESEVAAITPPAGVTGIFPYGYVVRSALAESTSRQLAAAASANQFDGLLTVSFRVPMQASSSQDVFSIFFEILAVQDSETRLTESVEEGQDTAAVRRLRERAASLGATTVTVLPGSTVTSADVADYTGQRQICSVRTAGTAASPVTYITAPGAYSRLEMLLPGESASACGASFRSGTAATPTLGSPYAVNIRAMDRYGNVLTSIADSASLSQLSGPSATFGAAAVLAAGQATINVTYSSASPSTSVLRASGRRLRGQRSVSVAVPATVVVNGGDNQAAMAGVAVPTAPSVLVRDLGGNPLSGVAVTFSVTGGGGSVTGGTTTTNASGIATVGSWVMGSTAALNTLSASAAGASTPATFKGSGCSGGGAGYAITLCYTTTMTAAQRAAFDSAAAKWGRVITGDLANVSASIPASTCGTGSPSFNMTIDDLLIFATVEPIDGSGAVLGSAGPCYTRNTGGLTVIGRMRFDSADMSDMESNGLLSNVILHEMGHVLGIGTLWSSFGLLQSPSSAGSTLDTYFSGTNGIAGFNSIGGSTYTGGNKVPVENTGGTGTMNAHWRESVLANELMTGYASVGSMPLSLLTARSLSDMGYTVNTGAADPFFLTLSLRADGPPARGAVPLGNDILNLPLYSIDPRGRIARVR